MVNQVLSIDQMRELQELGIDTSNASMVWSYYEPSVGNEDEGGEYQLEINDWIPKKAEYPDVQTFTLQDILELLTDIGKEYANHLHLFKASDGFHWYCSYGTMTCDIKGKTPLDAAFEMLKWCKENKYI